jgi:MoaA/NifB/PqqE/SkfB family radical SAM enzyme
MEKRGVHVPPFMIVSVTNRCNLKCKGCYMHAQHRSPDAELSEERLRGIVAEAQEMGISIMLIAGGEPLVRRDIMQIMGDHPEIIFPLFTNGLMIDEATIATLKSKRNIVPIISLEGHEALTDARRGAGVYDHLRQTISTMREEALLFGTSLTLTSVNFDTITSDAFVGDLVQRGCKVFFFVEYVPAQEGTEALVLSEEQKARIPVLMKAFRARQPGLFIAFPGDEEELGGCMAAGRGFVHISATGDVEPCPFASFSDTNVRTMSLREALRSPYLQKIRENHHALTETGGGCVLWTNREWAQGLLTAK